MTVRVALAGSTGSIGTQTLEVLSADPFNYELTALAASGRQLDLLVEQARRFQPKVVAVSEESAGRELTALLPQCEVRAGAEALASLATEADVVVNGVLLNLPPSLISGPRNTGTRSPVLNRQPHGVGENCAISTTELSGLPENRAVSSGSGVKLPSEKRNLRTQIR